jgi:hypothetical protein
MPNEGLFVINVICSFFEQELLRLCIESIVNAVSIGDLRHEQERESFQY